ncbi:MAG: hypothetical protein CL483_04680 [Acidobacteria bacterium]|nr:hypothetical protein [Acidobacteriota bacterium]
MYRTLLLPLVVSLAAAASLSAEPDDSLLLGFEQAYNLDHDEAIVTLQQAVAENPGSPAAHRSLAAITWMRILFLRGSMTIDDYLSSVTPKNRDMPKPPEELAEIFRTHSERAIALSEALVDTAPRDPNAYYELGASLALAASYIATIEGKTLAALRPAKAAYSAHEKVLELEPGRKDAMLVVGTYRYLVSTLPFPVRMMARLVGFGANRQQGLDLIRQAAEAGGEIGSEAQFGLVLLYNREGRFGAAQRVLRTLRRQYPRNRLLWLETAATALRDDRPALAAARLSEGFDRMKTDKRVRMFGEEALWHYLRGATWLELDRDGPAQDDLLMALEYDARLWVQGRTHLELGKLADLSGDRSLARDYYNRAEDLCDDGRDRRGVNAAKRLRKNGYRR